MMAACTPLVWFGQVQVLEEEHHSVAVFWSEDTVHIGGLGEAHLSQLLQDVDRSSLCTALHSGYLGGSKWHKAAAKEQSGKGVRKHMCCATPSLNGAFIREQLSIHVKTKVTVEMHVSSGICTYMGSVCVVGCVYLGLGVCVCICVNRCTCL